MGLGLGLFMGGVLLKSWVGEPNKNKTKERFPNPDDLYGLGAWANHGWDASEFMGGRAK